MDNLQVVDAAIEARHARINRDVKMEDVVADIHGTMQDVISCPFCDRSSKPSFHLYPKTNDAYCFACNGYYDVVSFVCCKWGCTRPWAIQWLEQHYNLLPIPDAVEADDSASTGVERLKATRQWGYDQQIHKLVQKATLPGLSCDPKTYDLTQADVHQGLYTKWATEMELMAEDDPARIDTGARRWAVLSRNNMYEMLGHLDAGDLIAMVGKKFWTVIPGPRVPLTVAALRRLAEQTGPTVVFAAA